jgi:hypothetical protein
MRVRVQYNTDGEKKCTKCNEFKDVSNFHKWSKGQDGLKLQCKPCVKEYDLAEDDPKRIFPRKHKENLQHCRKCNEYLDKKDFWSNNTYCRDCTGLLGHISNLKKYGMSRDSYVDLELKQNGVCAICKNPEMNKKRRLSIDHDHSCCPGANSCGKCIRGLLCSNCNTFLGNAKDDVKILKAAIEYLQK